MSSKRIPTLFFVLVTMLIVLWLPANHLRAEKDVTAVEATYVVNSVADPGDGECNAVECTLREAINAANANLGQDLIAFDIAGAGRHTIQPLISLPVITDPVIIDGYTQPGAVPNTNTSEAGLNTVLQIAVDGSQLPGNTPVIHLNTENSIVSGLCVQNSRGAGVLYASTGIRIDGGGGNRIVGSFIGTDLSGTDAAGHFSGIYIVDSGANLIGGATPGERNLISGNVAGISLHEAYEDSSTVDNVIAGNLIGTDITGLHALVPDAPPDWLVWGIAIIGSPERNRIGGETAAERNVISGHDIGVYADDTGGPTGMPNYIVGNYIGTDVTGMHALANGVGIDTLEANRLSIGSTSGGGNVISGNGVGIRLDVSGHTVWGNKIGVAADEITPLGNIGRGIWLRTTNNIVIGGADSGSTNVIAHNGGEGIFASSPVTIQRNAIYDNGALGIDNAPEGVSAENVPTVIFAESTGSGIRIKGNLTADPDQLHHIEFFANRACDPSGYGEGEQFLGSADVMTDATGYVEFDVTVPPDQAIGQFITATATNAVGSTSEFSECRWFGTVTYVELVSFTASADPAGLLTLEWETAAEIDNAGFNLYRRVTDSDPDTNLLVNPELIASQSSAGSGARYAFTDAPGLGDWTYSLASITTDGFEEIEDSVDVVVQVPTSAELTQFEANGTDRIIAFAVLAAVGGALLLGMAAYLRSRPHARRR